MAQDPRTVEGDLKPVQRDYEILRGYPIPDLRSRPRAPERPTDGQMRQGFTSLLARSVLDAFKRMVAGARVRTGQCIRDIPDLW